MIMKPQAKEALAYIVEMDSIPKDEWTDYEFLVCCKEIVRLAHKYPGDKSVLAYWIVVFASYFPRIDGRDPDELRRTIWGYAADLELPDVHVDIGDGLSIKQKWRAIGDLADEGIAMLIRQSMMPSAKEPHDLVMAARCKVTVDDSQSEWTPRAFLLFCQAAIRCAHTYPADKDRLAYWIVELGRYFPGFYAKDRNRQCGAITRLAAKLEAGDKDIDISDGLTIAQKWKQLEALVDQAVAGLEV